MSLARDIELLRKVALLSDFPEDQLRLLAFSAENVSYRDGQVLFAEGERADCGYVIADGKVLMERGDPAEQIGEFGPGTLIGETALLIETRRPARAVAVGATEAIRIRRALFKRMLEEFPEIAGRMFEGHAARFQATAHALARIGNRLEQIEEEAAKVRAIRAERAREE